MPARFAGRASSRHGRGARAAGSAKHLSMSSTERDPAAVSTTAPAIELRDIVKRFPGVVANDGVNLTVRPGSVHAIVGENGAGKSTLMKTLYGAHRPDEGTIIVNGETVDF